MAKPPPTPPSSDIRGANRDARAGTTDVAHDDAGGAIQGAKEGAAARPDETDPPETGAGQGRDD